MSTRSSCGAMALTEALNVTSACGNALEPLKTHLGDLVLLALPDKRTRRCVLEDSVVECGDYAAGRPTPDLECPRDQALPDDIIEQPQSRDHLERCGVHRRCTRRFVARIGRLEQPHRHTALG